MRFTTIAAVLAVLLPLGVGQAQPAPGSLDRSFGSHGKVTTAIGSRNGAWAVAVQRDGKIVVAGEAARGSTDRFALVRYNRNGSRDKTFGVNGVVMTSFGLESSAFAVALQRNGKIIAAGVTSDGSTGRFALVRYNRNGSLDSTFGEGGKVATSFAGAAFAVAAQPDGKIVAGGGSNQGFALVRYEPSGSLDPTFGKGGIVTTPVDLSYSNIYALALQSDGKIAAVGNAWAHEFGEWVLARYTPDGSLDASFGSGGKVTLLPRALSYTAARAVALQPNGKIVVAGTSDGGLTLARFKQDGSLDGSFGDNGQGMTVNLLGSGALAEGVALQRNGKIVVAGTSVDGSGKAAFALARFERDGSPDFEGSGVITTSFGRGNDSAHGVALQRDGRIVVAGSADENGPSGGRFAVARYLGAFTCVVPRVTGDLLPRAKRVIRRAHCSVGRITHAFSSDAPRGRVTAQRPGPGAKRHEGAKVNLVVSKGKRQG